MITETQLIMPADAALGTPEIWGAWVSSKSYGEGPTRVAAILAARGEPDQSDLPMPGGVRCAYCGGARGEIYENID